MGRTRDALSTRIKAIDKKLAALTELTTIDAEGHSIVKVHEQLLKVNEKAYKPVLLAIGPYNDHGKVGHGFMEEHKLRYLKQMLQRRNARSVRDYISALSDLEERARNCYAERISLKKDEFVEMMLLDGCFIIELFRKYEMWFLTNKHDPIFQMSWMLPVIARDLILFENQLPYFVLTKLFEMSARDQTPLPSPSIHSGDQHTINIEQNNEITCLESPTSVDQRVQIRRLGDLAIFFFSGSLPFDDWDVEGSSSYSAEKPFRLCRMHKAITPPLAKMVKEHLKVGDIFMNANFKHLLDLIHKMIKLSVLDMELDRAIERCEVGIKFKKGVIFKQLFGLIHGVVSALLAKLENMKKGGNLKSICYAIEHLYGPKTFEDWNSIPYGIKLHDAGVKFEMAKKFKDKLSENDAWKYIPDAIAFQEAGVELEKAYKFIELVYQERPNEDDKSKLFLNKIENWNSIPHGSKFKHVGIEFKKAKKFRDIKNMINSPKRNATELKEAGVKFKKGKKHNMFAIEFSNGVLEISPLRIEDETETVMRNLIAYEQYRPYSDLKYVTDYMRMLDDFIDSQKDVELLRQKGIIENYLGNDECASNMVNKLGCHVKAFSSGNSIYDKTSIEMNKHCEFVWNEWKAKLRHDYFNSPWALLSVLAAISLLGLAIAQTVFSIIR